MTSDLEKYEYETKCRRCGKFTNWYFSDVTSFDWEQFAEAIQSYIEFPRSHECEKCKKHTVQDVVSFTQPHEMKKDGK